MREHRGEFKRLNLQPVIITFENDYFARAYVAETGLNWPLLVDPQRESYRSYGILQASFWDLWGPQNWWVYLKELLKGGRLRLPTDDIYQRGGDLLIDPDGIVQLHHIGRGPADRPAVATILQRIEALSAPNNHDR